MSATLVVFVPVALLGLVVLLGFVGCGWTLPPPTHDFGPYLNALRGTPGALACWPLAETSGTVASEIMRNHFDGTYMMGPTGGFMLNQDGIVRGDTIGRTSTLRPCASFDGGFVSVPFHAELAPLPPEPFLPLTFTIEAWVLPDWTDVSFRGVVVSNEPAMHRGFALFAGQENFWGASIGNGTNNIETQPTASAQPIVQRAPTFLVMNYDGAFLKLFVNPADPDQEPYAQAAATGFVPVVAPIPLFIGIAHPDLPTPLLPFRGKIQDVAIYNVELDMRTIVAHFEAGRLT